MRRSRLDRSDELAEAAATGRYERTRREHEASGRPFWDFWGTSTEAA